VRADPEDQTIGPCGTWKCPSHGQNNEQQTSNPKNQTGSIDQQTANSKP